MSSPFQPAKIVLFALFAFAVLGMLVGFLLAKAGLVLLGVPIAFFATMSAIRQFGRFVRLAEMERKWLEDMRGFGAAGAADQADLPERIFVLLCTVAEADGTAGPNERALIRQFVLSRFPDPELAVRLARWDVKALDTAGLQILLRDLRLRLPRQDRDTVFHWCALVALVDERFNEREHDLLQTVARELGIAAEHARVLFLHAKARVMGERAWRRAAGGGGPRPAPTRNRRAAALDTLGLAADATPDQIRKRHRELVKKHHPDTHSHLGPVAQQEATERFREIQEAYEVLTGVR